MRSFRPTPLILIAVCLPGCRTPSKPPAVSPPTPQLPDIRFTRVTESAGIRFRHVNGESGKKWFPEWLGGGAAFLDSDGDGDDDVFLVSGASLPGWRGTETPTDRLFRNDDGRFTDVTGGSGLRAGRYGIGCCVGDFDGDGNLDLFSTGFEGTALYRGRGDGTFVEVTLQAGAVVNGMTTGCAFGDADGDGDLDLYVCRYVRYDLSRHIPCYQMRGTERRLVMCRQTVYPAAPDVLLINDGKGRFKDGTQAAGLRVEPGRGLGVLWTDFDADGRPDIYVANDLTPNFLFRNLGSGRFQEVAVERGVAVSEVGRVQAGMGLATADADGDGQTDIFVTNFTGEYTTQYRQDASHFFSDVSALTGLVEATRPFVGFGLGLEDFDRDGAPDVFMANGHVSEDAEKFYEGIGLRQAKLVLRNDGAGGFIRLSEPWSDAVTAELKVGRGAAFGDFDRDGDVDALASNLNDAPDLLRNDTGRAGNWLGLRLVGPPANRSGIGSRIELEAGGRKQVREVQSGGSYCSQNSLQPLFGLGTATVVTRLTIRWPCGPTTVRREVRANQFLTVEAPP